MELRCGGSWSTPTPSLPCPNLVLFPLSHQRSRHTADIKATSPALPCGALTAGRSDSSGVESVESTLPAPRRREAASLTSSTKERGARRRCIQPRDRGRGPSGTTPAPRPTAQRYPGYVVWEMLRDCFTWVAGAAAVLSLDNEMTRWELTAKASWQLVSLELTTHIF